MESLNRLISIEETESNQGAEKSNRTGFFIVEWNSILKSSGEKTIPKVQNWLEIKENVLIHLVKQI